MDKMTDDQEEKKPRVRRFSVKPTAPTIPEESDSNDTILALVNGNPLVDPNTDTTLTNTATPRNRRRSSISILHTLFASNHLVPTKDARKRTFLVGSNETNDISSAFPNGRLLTIMVVTWNTGETSSLYEQNYTPTARETAKPKERMLNDMSDIFLPTFIDYVADLIIVCTQEMSVAKKRIDWEILLQEVIGPTHVLFHSIHFGTLSLCIFLRRDLIWFCTEPEEDIVKFRAMGPVRTKGSLVVTFNLFGTSFMIINSHFEAGDDSEGRSNRRLNFQHTTTKLSIPYEFVQRTGGLNQQISASDTEEGLKRVDSTGSLNSTSRPGVDVTKSCDCVLWAGDMNFRIDMSHEEVLAHCKESKYNELLLRDELRTGQMRSGDPSGDFKEANIDFPPTYKFDLRSSDDVYVKNRTPSYTDRILYRNKSTSPMECTQYKSVQGVKHSDHKPVVAHFHVKLKPGLYTGNLAYGKFNHEVYKRGCEQREQHHSYDIRPKFKRQPISKSSVCVLQ